MNMAPISDPKTMMPAAGSHPEHAPRGDLEVVQRVGDTLLAQDERDTRDQRHDDQAEGEPSFARDRREVDGQDQPADHRGRQDPAEVVDLLGRLVDVGRHEPDGHDQRDDRQRQGDDEDRAPLEVLEQEARHQGSECRDRPTEGRPQGDRPGPGRPGPQGGDQGEGRRVGHAGGDAADDPGEDEDLDRGRRGRDDAGRDRQQDAQDQHQLAPVAVAQGAEPQDGGGQTQRVADGHQVQRRLRRIERLADVGQRDVRDGQVQVGDRGHEDEREEDESRLLRTGPGVRGCGRGRWCGGRGRAGHEVSWGGDGRVRTIQRCATVGAASGHR